MKYLLIGFVLAWRKLISPLYGDVCKYYPSCSAYALEALERHGAAAGSYLTLRRLVRCHPWCDGGHDPVPQEPPRLFSRWVTTPPPQQPSSAKKSS